MHRYRRRVSALAVVAVATLLATACGSSSNPTAAAGPSGGGNGDKVTLRLGYLPNVTHAPAIIGVENGSFARQLGANVTLHTSTYNSGTEETTALLAGALDAAFVGPNPAINAYQKSGGALIRIVAGTASGGAFLVVKSSITSADQLRGKKLATPSLGNTQDVALRSWLESHGLKTSKTGGGDVAIIPQENSTTVTAFQTGSIDGAWVPEPYATKLEKEGGKVLVDEASLWPGGKFVTTNLVVTKKFLDHHADVVTHLLEGLVSAVDQIHSDPAHAAQLVSTGIGRLTGKSLSTSLVTASFKSIDFTVDPIASSLRKDADAAQKLGFITSTKLDNIYDLSLLNTLLQQTGKATIST